MSSVAVNTNNKEQADLWAIINQFHCSNTVFLSLPFIQVDKVCGQPKQQEGNLSSGHIVPLKEATEAQTLVLAHASLNNKRR